MLTKGCLAWDRAPSMMGGPCVDGALPMNVLPTSAIKTTLEAAPRVARTMPSGEAPIVDQFTAVGGSAPREAAPATAESPATAPAAKPAATSVTIPRALLCETPAAPALAPVIEGYDRSYLDTSVRPQDDFYQYAVGGYIKNNPIPEDRDRYGVRTELYERIQNTLRGILDDAAAQTDAPLGSVAQKIGDFYASAMNTDAIEAAGAKPLQPMFERIARLQTTGDVAEEVANLHGSGYGGLFAFGASQDMKNPEMIIAETSQGGLSLPGKEYYLKDDERSVKVRAAFVDHMTKMFQLLGDDAETAARNARTVMDVETSMAKGAMARVEMRDPKALDHITSREELRQMAPHFDWNRYFSTLGTPSFETLNVATPNFFKTLDEQLATRPVEDWKTYLRWKVIDQSAGFLSADFEKQNFEFKGKALSGTPTQTERWKRMVNLTDGFLGEAVGQKFVEKTFPPEAKARALEMVDNIKFVLRDRIENLTWMGPETKKEALAKIDRLRVKIGYPDRWKDYSG
ncbi:MAG: hypothetical protein FJX76_24995, partial [Armatimonadetes bacterium]|nr:hypothetical protein [Armatimonadota bacterium]